MVKEGILIREKRITALNIIEVILLTILTFMLAVFGHMLCLRKAPKHCDNFLQYEYIEYDITEEELKKVIDNAFGTKYKLVRDNSKFTGPNQYAVGYVRPIAPIVYMREEFSYIYNFGSTLAHEITHIKYLCANECWTEYQSIIELYESGIPVLQQIALYETNVCIQCSYDEYDCSYYLVEYFNSKGVVPI